jgi:hypothetical protein
MSILRSSEGRHDLLNTSPEPLAGEWAVVAFRLILFVGGMAILASIPSPGDSRNNFALFLDRIQGHKTIQITEVAASSPVGDRVDPSPARSKLTPVRTSTEPSPLSPKALGGGLVQEFWRSIITSSVMGRYDAYLRDYPTGIFAGLATARIKDLQNVAVSVPIEADNPENISSSKTVKRKTSTKPLTVKTSPSRPPGRCWSGNTDGCKERCRAGDVRACQKTRRLGD